MIDVEVVYCPQPGVTDLVVVTVPDGATLQAALDASGVLPRHGLQADGLRAGVWGRMQALTAALRDRDRVEIYRPLQCDPKEARRLRYRQRSTGKKTAGA